MIARQHRSFYGTHCSQPAITIAYCNVQNAMNRAVIRRSQLNSIQPTVDLHAASMQWILSQNRQLFASFCFFGIIGEKINIWKHSQLDAKHSIGDNCIAGFSFNYPKFCFANTRTSILRIIVAEVDSLQNFTFQTKTTFCFRIPKAATVWRCVQSA